MVGQATKFLDFMQFDVRLKDRWYTLLNSLLSYPLTNILDISITFAGERPNAVLQLKVLIAGNERKYIIAKSRERTISQILKERM